MINLEIFERNRGFDAILREGTLWAGTYSLYPASDHYDLSYLELLAGPLPEAPLTCELFVKETARGRGYGGMLIERAIEHLQSRGGTHLVHFDTDENRLRLSSRFIAQGYTPLKTPEAMRKPLGSYVLRTF